jgi:hypothetical protein
MILRHHTISLTVPRSSESSQLRKSCPGAEISSTYSIYLLFNCSTVQASTLNRKANTMAECRPWCELCELCEASKQLRAADHGHGHCARGTHRVTSYDRISITHNQPHPSSRTIDTFYTPKRVCSQFLFPRLGSGTSTGSGASQLAATIRRHNDADRAVDPLIVAAASTTTFPIHAKYNSQAWEMGTGNKPFSVCKRCLISRSADTGRSHGFYGALASLAYLCILENLFRVFVPDLSMDQSSSTRCRTTCSRLTSHPLT